MQKMIKKKKIISSELYSKLFFSKDDLKKLDKQGHLIGPHSHFHPTLIENLTTYKQKYEYEKAMEIVFIKNSKQVQNQILNGCLIQMVADDKLGVI